MPTSTYQPIVDPAAVVPGCGGCPGERPLHRVVGADLPVPVVTSGALPYANLDYAASAPALVGVAEHVAAALPYYASVHRGAGYASQVSTVLLENARTSSGAFLVTQSVAVLAASATAF